MLGWVTGATRSAQRDEKMDPDDAPDTPAHIFAARAFKSLIFGTPAPNDATVERPRRFSRLSSMDSTNSSPRRHSTDNLVEQQAAAATTRPVMQPRHSDPMASPSKGILVAPGSVSTKRKSVTFGGLERDLNALPVVAELGARESDDTLPSPVLSPIKVKLGSSQQDLRRTLFEQRTNSASGVEGPSGQRAKVIEADNESGHDRLATLQNKEKTASDVRTVQTENTLAEEQTIDLDRPRSTSGQHWKREYERDHDNSKAEMKKLIQYSQMTKSYAEKRDRDAVTVTQKLNAAETKAKSLEKKIQKLTVQLMDAKTQDEDHASILNEVANQTAEIMKYQSKAERYRTALRKNESLHSSTDEEEEKMPNSSSAEIARLRVELAKLKLTVDRAESHASGIEKENAILNDKIEQMRTARTKQEQQHDELSARLKQKEGRLQEDNSRLGKELQAANTEIASLKQRLQAIDSVNITPAHSKSHQAQEKLFDLSYSRLTKEPTPPTSDEELRSRITSLRRKSAPPANPTLDFSLTEESQLQSPTHPQPPSNDTSDIFFPRKSRRQATLPSHNTYQHRPHIIPASNLKSETDLLQAQRSTPALTNLDQSPDLKATPVMKSFIDDLGTRRYMPPERIAAARKRLEEKAAIRRGTPKYGRMREKIGL